MSRHRIFVKNSFSEPKDIIFLKKIAQTLLQCNCCLKGAINEWRTFYKFTVLKQIYKASTLVFYTHKVKENNAPINVKPQGGGGGGGGYPWEID